MAPRPRPATSIQGWPPRWFTVPPAGLKSRGPQAAKFIEAYCRITKESVGGKAGEPLRLRGWQRALLNALLTEDPSGRLHYRHALIGVARKNGKSSWGAAVALFGLFFGGDGAEVYSCAGDKEQARIVFGTAKRMIELDPELRARCRVLRDAIEVIETGAVYRVLSAEEFTKEGLNPSLVIFDEVHVQPDDGLWNVMELASGARVEPLMVGITTAGVRTNSRGEESLCYRLYRHGQDVVQGLVDDPTFFFAWWEPVAGAEADHRDPKVWAEANPGFGDVVAVQDFESTLHTVPEPEFRTKRTNVFVSSRQSWLPYGSWENCLQAGAVIPDGESVVLGFDGSYNNDSTAIVAATLADRPLVQTVRVWGRPEDSEPDWAVPVIEVENEIRRSCRRWRVTEIACDPHRWVKSLQTLAAEGLPIIEFPQSPERMRPATQRFYEAVMNGGIVHGDDPVLARHLNNSVLKVDERGVRIVKQNKSSEAKIDAALAAVMAFDRAAGKPNQASGWLQYWRGEIANQAATKDVSTTLAAANARQLGGFVLEADFPGAGPHPSLCEHRWNPASPVRDQKGQLVPSCAFCHTPKP